MDYFPYLLLILGFLGLFGLIESVILFFEGKEFKEAKQLKQRLQLISGQQPSQESKSLKRGAYSRHLELDRFLKKFPQLSALDTLLRQTGRPHSVAQTLGAMLFCAVLGVIVGVLLGFEPLFLPVSLVIGALLPIMALRMLRGARMKKIEQQLPDALDLLGQSMRAGHAFSSALRTVGTEGPEPIASEFRMTSDEISFGATVREGILNLATRVNSMDMRYFALAILIQNETGGNLSGLMLELAKLIRERLKLRRTVAVLAAEGRLSGWILGSLPFLFAGLMMLISPGYISFFWKDPDGWPIVKIMGALLLVGAVWIRRVINIQV